MKIIIPAVAILLIAYSCNPSSSEKDKEAVKPAVDTSEQAAENHGFFPVTDYFKGQIFDIGNKHQVNPLKYITIKNHTDSSWLKVEEIPAAVKEFLTPVIDSTNLISLFTEKKFLDQTLDAFTFTYDPSGLLPDSMKLVHWDVYIDPKSGKVKRVYMVKDISATQTLQLTWIGDKWCKITTIANKPDGSTKVEKEEKIVWDFDN